jgi:hypothetical protein
MQQSRRKFRVPFIAALLVFCLALTSCNLFAQKNTEASQSVVGDNGADLTVAGVHIIVAAGAVPAGTKVEASFEDRNPEGVDGESLRVLAKAFKIKLGDGLQPSKPLTVTVPVDKSLLASWEEIDTSKTVAMMVQSEGASTPDLVQAVLDPEAGTITAQVPHLSWVWPVQLNLGAVMKTVRDTIMQSLGIEYPKPDCVDKPVTIGASTYRAVSPAQAWLCVGESNGSLTVTASPNSPIPFLTATAPAAAASNKVEVSGATAFSVALAQNSGFIKKHQSIMMPGADAQYTFDGTPASVRIGFQQYPAMLLISILSKVFDTALGAFVRSNALEILEGAGCMQNIVDTSQAGSKLTAASASGIVKSFFGCAGTALELSPPAQILLAIINAGPQFLVASALGIINEFTGGGNFESKIEAIVIATNKTYSGSAADVSFSFQYPSTWKVSGTGGLLKIEDAGGSEMATLDVLPVWGLESLPLMAPVAAESTFGSFSLQAPKTPCASCTYHVSTKVVDSTRAIDPDNMIQDPARLGWPKPILVTTSLSAEQAPAPQANVIAPYGVAVVNSPVTGSNGSNTRAVIFANFRYFPTVDEAKAWMVSAEHAQVEKMIATIRVN